MPTDAPFQPSARGLFRSRSGSVYRGILPSWFFSIWFHIFLLIATAFGLRSCTGRGDRGESDAEWQTVGLVMRTNVSDAEQESPSAETSPLAAAESEFEPTSVPEVPSESTAASESDFPRTMQKDLPSVLGPGSAAPSFSEAIPAPFDESRAATGPVAPSGLARGETQFFSIRAKGERLVYVIDVSGSMSTPPTAIRSAKTQLLSSLSTLSGDQSFQVVFFNVNAEMMRIRGQAPGELIAATDINRTLAEQEIIAVRPSLGTRPVPALTMALQSDPDVVFFLTDAQEGALTPKDLDRITRLNDGRARIHAIEFGKGDRLRASSVLERLAANNGGAYEYHDVLTGE